MLCAKLLLSCRTLSNCMDCVARQAPLSLGFSRQEYWSELPFPPPGDLPDPGISCVSCIGRQVLYHSATWEAPLVAFQVFKQEPLLSELFYIQYCMHSTFLKYQVSSFEVGMYRCQNPSSGHIPELIPGLGWSLMLPHQLSHTSV